MKYFITAVLFMTCAGCHPRKISLNGDEKVDAKDFFAAFPVMNLPVVIADTNLYRFADTTNIAYSVMSSFLPDSTLQKITLNAGHAYQIHPVGSIEKQDEIYLLATFSLHKRKALLVFLFNSKHNYLADLVLLDNKKDDGYHHSVSINREPTFIISREKTSDTNQYLYTKNGYSYSSDAGSFMLLLNDSNEDPDKINEIIDPIDTLPMKHRFSGNYMQDKRDFIAVRDGKNPGTYSFFIHFEKNDGQCIGELKGTMQMTAPQKAVYRENVDACMISFTFSSHSVYVKENGSCGNHRGIRCYFDDSYPKEKGSHKILKGK